MCKDPNDSVARRPDFSTQVLGRGPDQDGHLQGETPGERLPSLARRRRPGLAEVPTGRRGRVAERRRGPAGGGRLLGACRGP